MIPAQIGAALGLELLTLTADDRARLQQILWLLRGELRRRDSDDLNASTAYVLALALAGQAEEARAAAIVCEELRRARHPEVPVHLHLNVLFGLINAGLLEQAVFCFGSLDKTALDSEMKRFLHAGVAFTLRFGIPFPEGPWGVPASVRFLRERGLYEHWQAQQVAVEKLLGDRVAMIEHQLERLEDGDACDRLVITYHTSCTSYSGVDALDAALWQTLEEVYQDRPGGAGAVVGNVIFEVRGPRIPLEDMTP